MIPHRLRLRNFLSYRDAVLDFQGLHTVCICGANGAGKSSLLEAITWALWGKSRAVLEDDVIHLGAQEAQVDLTFQSQGQRYRVIRRRHRQQSVALEFQIAGADQTFRSLTAKGVRATQQLIIQTLRLDYHTFINSAYLRQGRADEFMLKRPNERKQVLADLLKLNRYDNLAEQARERSRQFRAEAQALSQAIGEADEALSQKAALDQELASLSTSLAALQQEQRHDQTRLQQLQERRQQRQTQLQRLQFRQQERDRHRQAQNEIASKQTAVQTEQAQLQTLLGQADAITQGYKQWQKLQRAEEQLAQTAQRYHQLQTQQLAMQQAHQQSRFELERRLERLTTQQQQLEQQEQELQPILAKATEIETAIQTLEQARSQLKTLDQLQAQVSPLLLRQRELEIQLQAERTRLTTRLEALERERQALQTQRTALPQLQTEFEALIQRVQQLEERDRYREVVRNKGQERRLFLDRLQAHQLDYEMQLAQVEQRLEQIEQPEGCCPCCDRPLNSPHREAARSRYRRQRQELIDRITVIVDQIFVSKKEIEVVRQEYRSVKRELKRYGVTLERKGQLKQQLTASLEQLQQYQELEREKLELETQLSQLTYAPALQAEWQQLQQRLQTLGYDDRNHALARGEVERWRWAQIRQSELHQAQKRWDKLQSQRPQLAETRQQLEAEQQQLNADQQRQCSALDQELSELHYCPQTHDKTRQALRQAQVWQQRQPQLIQAQAQLPQLQQQQAQLAAQLTQHHRCEVKLSAEIETLSQQLAQTPDPQHEIEALDTQLQNRRPRLDRHLAEQGRLQQRQQQLVQLAQQYAQQQNELKRCHHQQRIYQELVRAFGKSGIQTLMIENLLPQLERETNHILSRLSNHQLHVQFITQKAKRSPGTNRSAEAGAALIDTLDIRIADAKGTRPYETYSGGEAFRVNFSIRLALAKLLAQRAGTSLQLLIVDEGFGTQDAEGCDRLIAALNAIAPDFACILTITHMPQFKEAFQTRIEVSKTELGSQLAIAT